MKIKDIISGIQIIQKTIFFFEKLIHFLKINFQIIDENVLHSDIAPHRKKDPGEKFLIKKIGINRFKNKKIIEKNYNIDEMLNLYGFNRTYIKKYKDLCIKAVKRSLNYNDISSFQSKKFLKDFYNLLFS